MSQDFNSRLLALLQTTARAIQSRMCDIDGDAEKLTIVQIRTLDALNHRGQMTMADLAKHLGITPASATSLVERMVMSGWLKREHDPNDRRKIQIAMSQSKLEVWRSMEQKRIDRLSSFLQVLSPEQKQDFIHILESLTGQSPERHQ
jgi:DNA-binding MarR family transcriptional regulator